MKNDNQLILIKGMSQQIEKEIDTAPVLKSILDATPFAMNVWNKDMVNIMCNKHVLDIFNMEDPVEYLENFYKFSPEYQPNGISSYEMSKINFAKAIDQGEYVFHWMHRTLDGEDIPSEITLIRLNLPEDMIYLVGFVRDMRPDFSNTNLNNYNYYFTDKIPTDVMLNEMSMLSDEWFFSSDVRTGNISYYGKIWQNFFKDTTLITPEKIFDSGFIHKDDIDEFKKLMNNLKLGIEESYEIRVLTENNSYHYYEINCKIIRDKVGTPIFMIGKGSDIQNQKIFEERSQKDLLTDCYNKVSAENIIDDKLKEFNKGNHVLFIVDIDNFKGINDNLGHYFGDEVLRDISKGLKEAFRDEDIIARIGGDEFVVFMENIHSPSIIKEKAEKILDVYKKTYPGEYNNYSISGSIGVARYPQDGDTYVELYQNSDKALNQAKLEGKNRYVIYSDALDIGTTRNITKIENANRMAGAYFDYDLISAVFNILYEHNGDNRAINLALSYICQKYNADRSYIFESIDEGVSYSNTFEYCKEGINSEINNLQNISGELFADFVTKAKNDIIYSNNLRETLEIDEAFDIMANQGILSFIHAQIKRDGIMTFFLGLDDCTKTRVWSEREINSVQYISKLISIILQGNHLRNAVKELSDRNRDSAYILNNTDSFIYVSDVDTYEILYLNNSILQAVGNPSPEVWRGKKCYELLQGKEEPCDFCTNHLLEEDKNYEWSYFNPILGKPYLLKDKLIPFNGKLARIEIATDISQITSLEQKLQERLFDEHFLTNCIETLHSGKDPDASIYTLLEAVADYYQGERSYIYELSPCGKFLNNTYEFCKEGVESFQDRLQNLPISHLRYALESCRTKGTFLFATADVDPSVHPEEFKLMSDQKLVDTMIGSISLDGKEITGFVGVDNPQTNKDKIPIMKSLAKFVASFLDETDLKAKLNQLSYYDTLTGIKNRHSYNNALKSIDTKDIHSLGVAYVDIAGLSVINDSKGIHFGDSILKELAETLENHFDHHVYRVGGDEFVVLMEDVDEAVFEEKIDKFRKIIGLDKEFTVSVGYTWNHGLREVTNLQGLHRGDKYSRILSQNLEAEIAEGKYVVFLQPQVNFATSRVESAEALVRRIGANNSLQPPVSFIPFYEKEGIISKIDIHVFETVCKTLKEWQDGGYTGVDTIAVNCSRITISENNIVEKFAEICDKYGVSRSKIVIEITETINKMDENLIADIITAFGNKGFAVSLDDFGSGYSNLTSLIVSDFDEVKIDMRLINKLHIDKKSRALTQVAISLCNSLDNVQSIAEGVEYIEQYDILRDMGCTKGQGYYFAKPLSLKEFADRYVYPAYLNF